MNEKKKVKVEGEGRKVRQTPTSGEDAASPLEKDAASPLEKEELQKRGAKIFACNERIRARIAEIAHLANECLLNTNHPNGYEQGQYGKDYRTYGKAMSEIRKLVKESIADVDPDYEMLALQFARKTFDFSKFKEALAAVASMKPTDFPGVYYTPDWLARFAKEQLENKGEAASSPLVEKAEIPSPEEQSALDREEARQKRRIHWKLYATKVDIAVMGKTDQNEKVYEVRINKRPTEDKSTYWETKVNGHRVFQGWFEGSAWMARRMLTAAMQALVNHKAVRSRSKRRRNYAKRALAARSEIENGGRA